MLKYENFHIYYFKIIKCIEKSEMKNAKRLLIIHIVNSTDFPIITISKLVITIFLVRSLDLMTSL